MKGVSDFYEPGIVDVKALLAGNDVLLYPLNVPKAIEEIKKAIAKNQITQKEIDARCLKILKAKQWMGLDNYSPVNLEKVADEIITNETELLDKKLVKSSLTLLQNYDDLLAFKKIRYIANCFCFYW